jgi:prolipoprotein diacylglyceryltransferase
MVNGGGHLTHLWFGIHYAGQVGKRVPVPLIQGAEDGLLWGLLILLERRWTTRFAGALSGVAMIIWGLVRAYDEHWLLGQESRSGSVGVQIAGLVLALAGVAILVRHVQYRKSQL